MAIVKSMADQAFDILNKKKRAMAFSKLWEEVVNTMSVSNDQIGQFYSDLTLDGRFVCLKKDNKWDLKERRKFNETHVDLEKIDISDDEDLELEAESLDYNTQDDE